MKGNLARCKSLVGSLLHGLIRAVQHQRHEIAVWVDSTLVEGVYLLQIVFLKRGRLKMVCVVD